MRLLLLLLVVWPECLESAYNESDLEHPGRSGRFFPLFTIIRFQNTECLGTSSFTGTCFTRRECTDIGGIKTTTCASKRGVCCVVQKQCGTTTNVNNTYFTNNGYPLVFNGGAVCSIQITRCNADICQLRIDLLDFALSQPDPTGLCNVDFLTVTGGASQVPRICGVNSGGHMYVNFNGNQPITITVTTSPGVGFNRRWNLKLTQLACNCPSIAPSGCLQYYTGVSGTVSSFNYGTQPNNALENAGNIIGTREIANLNYGVCVRMEAGYCSITWSQTADRYSFTVSGDVVAQSPSVGTPDGLRPAVECVGDFVIIPNPTTPANRNGDRFCGFGLPAVTSSSKPFVMTVVTNNDELGTGDFANRGFNLAYSQGQCLPF